MTRLTKFATVTLTLCSSALALAADDEVVTIGGVAMENSSGSAAFEAVKKKLGKWEGTMTQGLTGQVFDVSYEWKLTSGGNTITETIIEDGTEMLTTYSDKDGELVIQHYCALGTEPVFAVSDLSASAMSITVDAKGSDLHAGHHDFVTGMTWTMDASDPNAMVFENTVNIDGEASSNRAELKRSL